MYCCYRCTVCQSFDVTYIHVIFFVADDEVSSRYAPYSAPFASNGTTEIDHPTNGYKHIPKLTSTSSVDEESVW